MTVLFGCKADSAECGRSERDACSAWAIMLENAFGERGLSLDDEGLYPRNGNGPYPRAPVQLGKPPAPDAIERCRSLLRRRCRRVERFHTAFSSERWAAWVGASHGTLIAAAVREGYHGFRIAPGDDRVYLDMEEIWSPPKRTAFEEFLCTFVNETSDLRVLSCVVRSVDAGTYGTPEAARSHPRLALVRPAVEEALALWEQRQRENALDAVGGAP